ncbi:GOLPH3/VPS74 family protein [Kineosporia babensis]|uniref:GPP34 family phosphoprotein n=1 Tax=Kineosporia babensis TaxID=499548 RepID=A0A9X1T4A9_9ACTN|nr:GPP34 family phosphoprotein [Kineosporia babensis]MCD5316543.1 GPP34 family phosphoprotein [Kineosporia babensis]
MTEYTSGDTLLVEDLMLLLLHDEKGNVAGETVVNYILGGALLVELSLLGRVDQEEKKSMFSNRRILTAGDGPLPDPLLQEAFDVIAEKPRSGMSVLEKVGRGLPKKVAARLVERGMVREEKTKILGVFPRTLHPAVNDSHEKEVRREIRAVLADGAEPGPRSGALIALLSGSDTLKPALKDMDPPLPWSSEIRKRGKAIQDGEWGAKVVKDAVVTIIAVIAAGASAGAAGGAASS